MSERLEFFATTPRGLESVLARELREVGAHGVDESTAGVAFGGDLGVAYRACFWSRVANRILMTIARFPAPSSEALYGGIQAIDWDEHLDPAGTLAVTCLVADSKITNSHYGAQVVKDAIVDQMRSRHGARPSIDKERPQVRVNVYVKRNRARIGIDLSGGSLHRRGYRTRGVAAPLKENLAAGLLYLARWPEVSGRGGALVDVMCGSGTFLLEGWMMSADFAPGLIRDYYGLLQWRGHQPGIWREIEQEAADRLAEASREMRAEFVGFDRDPGAISAARANVAALGHGFAPRLEVEDLAHLGPISGLTPGLVIANPPYGERIGSTDPGLVALYRTLGATWRRAFAGWEAGMLSVDEQLALEMRIPPRASHALFNGPLRCQFRLYRLGSPSRRGDEDTTGDGMFPQGDVSMVVNRLRKNLRHHGRWARRNAVQCYRLYDADIPEYAFAVDIYQGASTWAHVQEYAPPARVDPIKAEARVAGILTAVGEVLDLPPARVFIKRRRRQRGKEQYQRIGPDRELFEVTEGGHRFLVNLSDYLDTGLFLDYRSVRRLVAELASGRRFLNLFGYTGTATVYAAAAGAASTTTVDQSPTYLAWAEKNLRLNGLDKPENRLVEADCVKWLDRAARAAADPGFDLILLDPPTFSNSKRTDTVLDIQRDHATLIRRAVGLLSPDGVLLFSTNARRFRLDGEKLEDFEVEEITHSTIPPDFRRNRRVHHCWRIRPNTTERAHSLPGDGAGHREQGSGVWRPLPARRRT